MPYFPYETFRLESPLPYSEVLAILRNHVEPVQYYRITYWGKGQAKEFEGVVGESHFKFTRIIRGRNSFKPILHGTMHDQGDSTVLTVQMKMQTRVYVFMALWLGIIGFGVIRETSQALSMGKVQSTTLIAYGMFVFGYLLALLSFSYESAKAKKILKRLLGSQEWNY